MCPLLSFWSLFLALFGLLSTIIETEIENKGLIFFFFLEHNTASLTIIFLITLIEMDSV